MQLAIDLFAMVLKEALPFAIVFAVGQRLVNLFISMAFHGEVKL